MLLNSTFNVKVQFAHETIMNS